MTSEAAALLAVGLAIPRAASEVETFDALLMRRADQSDALAQLRVHTSEPAVSGANTPVSWLGGCVRERRVGRRNLRHGMDAGGDVDQLAAPMADEVLGLV